MSKSANFSDAEITVRLGLNEQDIPASAFKHVEEAAGVRVDPAQGGSDLRKLVEMGVDHGYEWEIVIYELEAMGGGRNG
jgi:hypothetical protein